VCCIYAIAVQSVHQKKKHLSRDSEADHATSDLIAFSATGADPGIALVLSCLVQAIPLNQV
jgi:hypothetical protein